MKTKAEILEMTNKELKEEFGNLALKEENKSCSDCSGCLGCSGCSECSVCLVCLGCSRCVGCLGCSQCKDCFFCVGVSNLIYAICNIQMTKEEYEEKRRQMIETRGEK